MKTIVKMQFGSHLYGTSTPQSDTDLKAIHIPDARDILLQQVKGSIKIGARQKTEGERNGPLDVDHESYSLQRFMQLLVDGQTGPIEMLFAPPPFIIESHRGWWMFLRRNRDRLLTKKSASFLGYCRQQANKYGIKGSRVAAAKEASEFFHRCWADLGPTTKIEEVQQQLGDLRYGNEHMDVTTKETSSGNFETYFVCCNRMVGLKNSVKHAAEVYTKIYENYGERARKAQENEGVDWKALSHAVRVGHEAIELLTDRYITLPRPDASHLIDIKLGRLPYQQVSEEIEELLVKVEATAETSTLPAEPDTAFMEAIIQSAYGDAVVDRYYPTRNNVKYEVKFG